MPRYTLYFTGFFSDQVFIPMFGFDLANNKATIVGPGTAPVSWAARIDVGRFVAHTLTALPLERLAGKTLNFESDRTTLREAFVVWERVKGGKITVVERDAEEVRKSLEKATGMASVLDYLFMLMHDGLAVVGQPDNEIAGPFAVKSLPDVFTTYY